MNCTPTDLLAHDTMVRELLRPLLRYLALPGATEIVVNRPHEVYIEVGAAWEHHLAPDLTLNRLTALATAIATATEQEIGPHHPILSAMLPDGERVQIVLPPRSSWEPCRSRSAGLALGSRLLMSMPRMEPSAAMSGPRRLRWIVARPSSTHWNVSWRTTSPLANWVCSFERLCWPKRILPSWATQGPEKPLL